MAVDHKNIRILQTMISGILIVLRFRTRMYDPCVYLVSPKKGAATGELDTAPKVKPGVERVYLPPLGPKPMEDVEAQSVEAVGEGSLKMRGRGPNWRRTVPQGSG